eukprot:GEMP01028559.1.p1 GENE.GEMP01028559.1~~GEMP01028559.1.p1  ORF type:complete len:398 (+),score=104.50 GEMP01028559.1:121-1314(+)
MKFFFVLLGAQCSFLVRHQAPNIFSSLDTCNAAYDKLYEQCIEDGKTGGISAPPQHDHDQAGADKGKDDTAEPTADAKPRTPINKGDVGATSEKDAVPTYHPPVDDGEPKSDGWDYLQNGENWPAMCQGDGQSPIDIAKDIDIQGQTKFVLWFDYYADPDRETKPMVPELVNKGHGISFTAPENLDLGYVKLFHEQYTAKEYNFHSPSEHTIDGATFPLELQVLNAGVSGKLLAVAFFFREGASNKFLSGLMRAAGRAPRWNNGAAKKLMNKHIVDAFNLDLLVPTSEQHPGGHMTFYNYEGSLTQPPCTTGVDWWVAAKPLTASKEEIRFIRRAILESESTKHGNSRETQPPNGRRILVGMTNFQHAVKMPGRPGNEKKDSVQEPRGFSSQDEPWG